MSVSTRRFVAPASLGMVLSVLGAALAAGGAGEASPEALYAEAEEHLAASRVDEAAAALERAVELGPESWRAWTLLGFCRLKQRLFTESLEACARALALRPKEPRASLWAAVCLKELRRTDEAIEAYEKVLESGPGRFVVVECHWGLAECKQVQGERDEADRHVAEVATRDGRRGRILEATLRMRRGDFRGAKRRFDRLYRTDDEHPLILYGLATCCLKVNQDQEFALRLLEKVEGAPELDPTDVLLGRALALVKLARHVEAETLLKGLDPEVKLTAEQEAVRTEVAGAVKRALGE